MQDHPTARSSTNKGKPSTKMDHVHQFSSSQTVNLPSWVFMGKSTTNLGQSTRWVVLLLR